jgi:hypothetical protein
MHSRALSHARSLPSFSTLAATPLPLPASENHVGDQGATALAKCLEHNTALTSLYLG